MKLFWELLPSMFLAITRIAPCYTVMENVQRSNFSCRMQGCGRVWGLEKQAVTAVTELQLRDLLKVLLKL